jgi:hypothetical protein
MIAEEPSPFLQKWQLALCAVGVLSLDALSWRHAREQKEARLRQLAQQVSTKVSGHVAASR